MPTYTAHFYTEADYAETRIEAATPALALQRARQIESAETGTFLIINNQEGKEARYDNLSQTHAWSRRSKSGYDWGFDGPMLGPFEAVHFTYTTHVRCFPEGSDGDAEALELCYHNDMLVHDGKYYAALFNKGVRLCALGRNEEEIAVYDDVLARFGTATEPALREQVAKALINKGLRLDALDRCEEAAISAVSTHCRAADNTGCRRQRR